MSCKHWSDLFLKKKPKMFNVQCSFGFSHPFVSILLSFCNSLFLGLSMLLSLSFRLQNIYRTILRLIYLFNPFHSCNGMAFGYLNFTVSYFQLCVYTRLELVLMLLRIKWAQYFIQFPRDVTQSAALVQKIESSASVHYTLHIHIIIYVNFKCNACKPAEKFSTFSSFFFLPWNKYQIQTQVEFTTNEDTISRHLKITTKTILNIKSNARNLR